MTVALAASTSFMSPVAHPANVLHHGPRRLPLPRLHPSRPTPHHRLPDSSPTNPPPNLAPTITRNALSAEHRRNGDVPLTRLLGTPSRSRRRHLCVILRQGVPKTGVRGTSRFWGGGGGCRRGCLGVGLLCGRRGERRIRVRMRLWASVVGVGVRADGQCSGRSRFRWHSSNGSSCPGRSPSAGPRRRVRDRRTGSTCPGNSPRTSCRCGRSR